VMNWLGYVQDIIQARRDAYREWGRLTTTRSCGAATFIVTGSKAKGLSNYLQSDFDAMLVLNRVICLDDDVNASTFPGEITVLRSLSRMSYHGHCGLLLERRGKTIIRQVNHAFCDANMVANF